MVSVLSRSLGPDAELTDKVRKNRYGLMAFSDSTPESAWVEAHAHGVERAKGCVEAAIFELGLQMDSQRRRGLQARAATESEAATGPTTIAPPNTRVVMVVHGRNEAARDAIFEFLRSLDLLPIEWNQARAATGRPNPYIGGIADAAFKAAQAVVVLLTPDDEAQLRTQFRGPSDPAHEVTLTPQPRANVLFEAGMAMAWNENRTVLVELGHGRPFSDVAGRHLLRLDDTTQRRQELALRLSSAGLAVNMTGVDWHTAGEFEASVV